MPFQFAPKTSHVGTHAEDVTLTLSEIATALIPAMIGMAVVGLIALLMVM